MQSVSVAPAENCRSRGRNDAGRIEPAGVGVVAAPAEPALDVPARRIRRALEEAQRDRARVLDQAGITLEVGEAQERRAGLARAEELAGAADLQVAARDLEAVVGLEHRLQARLRRL